MYQSPMPDKNDQLPNIDLLILNGSVVTMNPDESIIESGALAIKGSRIIDIGSVDRISRQYTANKSIDATHHIVMPGLINAHTHSPMTLFRGLSDDLPLVPWLNAMHQAAVRWIRPETVSLAATLGYAEMVLGGTTTNLDMYFFPEKLVEAAQSVGIRLIAGPVFVSSDGVDGIPLDERVERGKRFIRTHKNGSLIVPCVSPHSAYDVNPPQLEEAFQLAEEEDVLFNIHAAETQAEVQSIRERYGRRPIEHLEALGILSSRTVMAHCVHVTEREIELMAGRGALAVHCPLSNLKLADGIAPVPNMASAGVKLALGTDGPGSSNDLNLWTVIRLAAVLHKGATLDPTALPAKDVMRMATIDAARALGLGDEIGSLETGKKADVVLIDLNRPHLTPLFNYYSHMVYAVGRDDVSTVVIDGKVVVRDRKLITIEIEPLMSRVRSLVADRS
ncbi:MAG: amidohydrolase [Anaerolineales bacterium]|nr:amidohydrolase [Anaerolineales bacterium]